VHPFTEASESNGISTALVVSEPMADGELKTFAIFIKGRL
jgi:hypothetical protein